jgi:hypothetical protein
MKNNKHIQEPSKKPSGFSEFDGLIKDLVHVPYKEVLAEEKKYKKRKKTKRLKNKHK